MYNRAFLYSWLFPFRRVCRSRRAGFLRCNKLPLNTKRTVADNLLKLTVGAILRETWILIRDILF